MRLCNFSNTEYHLNWYKQSWQELTDFLNKNKLDGIELLLHGNHNIGSIPKKIVKGLHLSYFPTWLDFYQQNDRFKEDFKDDDALNKSFGGNKPSVLLDRMQEEYQIARSLEVDYMVFHVSHVTIKEAFYFTHHHSNMTILDATAEWVNAAFNQESDIDLLFENLWWPGLQLLDKDELNYFMDKIHYKRKGVMLDLSHLLLTNKAIKNLEEAVVYIHASLDRLGDAIHWIKGIHINSTMAYEYFKINHKPYYDMYLKSNEEKRFEYIYDHISQLDQHLPFKHEGLKSIIERIAPQYEMIEVVGHTKEIWEKYVVEQLRYM